MNRLTPIAIVLIFGLFAGPAAGQLPGVGQPRQQEQQATRFHDSRDRVTVEVVSSHERAAPGDGVAIAVTFTMDSDWKIWAGDQPLPKEYFKTRIVPDSSNPDALVPLVGRIQWPTHQIIEFFGEELPVYKGKVTAYLPLLISEDSEPGDTTLTIRPVYQSCDDVQCLAPTPLPPREDGQPSEEWLEYGEPIQISIVSSDVLSEAERERPSDGRFGGFDWSVFDDLADDDAIAAAAADSEASGASGTTTPPDKEAGRPTFFGFKVVQFDGLLGLVVLAILSALGGLVLNLTPCVLPVIPIKVMTIMQHANKPGKNLVLGLWMALGVIAFWVGIGLPVAFVTGVTDPSQLFGIWWVTFGIGAIIALMGLGIMGLFSIQLPQSVYAVNPSADTPWGSFLFGVMTAVLGLPCFGFVAGALLAGVATLPPGTIMLIFTSLGVGMAVPYLILSLKPDWVEKIPRTGPASELVKQVMGLLLIAAAAYFIGAGLIALVAEHPYLSRQLHWWAVAIFAAIASLWMIVRTLQITNSAKLRATVLIVGAVVGGAALYYAGLSTGNARENWETRQAAQAQSDSSGYVTGYWNEWTPEAFEKARADGHVVVLDFTAEWCLNCKALKAAVLDRDPVRRELASSDVVKFTVDLTSRSAKGWDFLRELGQTGIPLLAIYAPGDDEPWQSNAYTQQQVMVALSEARSRDPEMEALSRR